jgi:hypothetical protein
VVCCVLLALVPLVAARREGGLPCGVDLVALAAVVVPAAGPRAVARLLGLVGRASAVTAPDGGGGPCPTGNR